MPDTSISFTRHIWVCALLGVAIELFGTLACEDVIGVYNLGLYQFVTLLGIGLAAGSPKEFVDKD